MGRDGDIGNELGSLHAEVRAAVRDWTDHAAHDPGVALLELFAFLAEDLARYLDAVAGEAYLGSTRRPPDIRVEVDGLRWQRVTDLAGAGPDDARYVVSRRDDGAMVVQFGDGEHGRRPPSEATVRVAYRRGSRFAAVEMQQGRVVIDADWNEPTTGKVFGIHRGVVVDSADPTAQGRLLVQVPAVTGTQALWAAPCVPAGASAQAALPGDGDTVWILFENADVNLPVWLGRVP